MALGPFAALVSETHAVVGGKVLCPVHEERTPSCHVYADHVYCFGCGWHGDDVDWIKVVHGCSTGEAFDRARRRGLRVAGCGAPAAKAPEGRDRTAEAKAAWRESASVGRRPRCAVRRHLMVERALAGAFENGAWPLQGLRERDGAMVARASAADGRLRGVQMQALDADGAKRGRPWSLGRLRGAAVYMGHFDDARRRSQIADGVVVLAEGVATALSAWLLRGKRGLPVATLGAGGMAAWEKPDWVRMVLIAADNDGPGRAAAVALGGRLEEAGVECERRHPPLEGDDYNDVLRRMADGGG